MHQVPDALSRLYETPMETINLMTEGKTSWYVRRFLAVDQFPKKFPSWRIEGGRLFSYRPDPHISNLDSDLSAWKLVPSDEQRLTILSEAHDDPQSGHLGVQKTYIRISRDYFWPRCFKDVVAYVGRCAICQTCKVDQSAPPGLMGQRVVEQPWIAVAADIIGPLPHSKSQFQYVLVIQDLFTKWVECAPLRSANGRKIKEALRDLVINRWGTPKVLLIDNGTEFVNGTLRSMAQEYGIYHTTTPPYHPQANPVERVNRVLKTMMISYIDQDHRTWDEHLTEFRFACNTAYHTSLKATPAFLNFGREPTPVNSLRKREEGLSGVDPQPPEVWKEQMKKVSVIRDWVVENLDGAFQKQAKYYNLRRREVRFRSGDLVLIRTHKLSDKEKEKTIYSDCYRMNLLISGDP